MTCMRYIIMVLLMSISCISNAQPSNYYIDIQTAVITISQYNKSLDGVDAYYILDLIKENALRTGTNPNTIFGIIINESSFNSKAIGPGKYSQGIMQVNTRYHKSKFKYSPLDLEDNIRVGTDILRDCQIKAHNNLERTIYCYRGIRDIPYLARIKKFKQLSIFNPTKD